MTGSLRVENYLCISTGGSQPCVMRPSLEVPTARQIIAQHRSTSAGLLTRILSAGKLLFFLSTPSMKDPNIHAYKIDTYTARGRRWSHTLALTIWIRSLPEATLELYHRRYIPQALSLLSDIALTYSNTPLRIYSFHVIFPLIWWDMPLRWCTDVPIIRRDTPLRWCSTPLHLMSLDTTLRYCT